MTGVGRIGACVWIVRVDWACCDDTGTVFAMIIECEWVHEGQSAPALLPAAYWVTHPFPHDTMMLGGLSSVRLCIREVPSTLAAAR